MTERTSYQIGHLWSSKQASTTAGVERGLDALRGDAIDANLLCGREVIRKLRNLGLQGLLVRRGSLGHGPWYGIS